MRALRLGVLCAAAAVAIAVANLPPAFAAKLTKEQKAELKEKLKAAKQAYVSGETETALGLIDEALAVSPKDLDFLLLRGHVLLKNRDFENALVAYQAFLDAGAKGGNRREVKKIVADLKAVTSTFLQVTVENGPADVYLDSMAQGVFCVADPICKKGVVPDDYKVILVREGYEKITQKVSVDLNQLIEVKKTLVEKSSDVTVTSTPPGAAVTLDGEAAGTAPAKLSVPPGDHTVGLALAHHALAVQAVTAHMGQPIDLAVALSPLVPVTTTPAGATLLLDGAPAKTSQGNVELPPDGAAHTLVAKLDGYHDANADIPADRSEDFAVSLTLRQVGALVSVKGAPHGAEVMLDGKLLGTVPLEEPVEIEPGPHTVDITAKGYLPFKKSATLKPNTATLVEITDLRRPGRRSAYWVSTAAGVGLAAGVVFSILAVDKENDYQGRAAEQGVRFDDADVNGIKDDGKRFALIADISYGASLLAAGVGVYLFIKEGKGFSSGRIKMTPNGVAVSF